MELKDYWNTIRKRWRIVLLTFLATIAVAAVVTFQMTPQYSSTAGIFVSTITHRTRKRSASSTVIDSSSSET